MVTGEHSKEQGGRNCPPLLPPTFMEAAQNQGCIPFPGKRCCEPARAGMGAGKDSERYLIDHHHPQRTRQHPHILLSAPGTPEALPITPTLPQALPGTPETSSCIPGTPKNLQNSLPDCCTPPPLQEFEVIAQIKLLQSACNNYSIEPEEAFRTWFRTMERLSEAEG